MSIYYIISYKKIKKQGINYTLFSYFGANEVVIYNFLALITIDTNINQFIKVYHIFDKLQYNYNKIYYKNSFR